MPEMRDISAEAFCHSSHHRPEQTHPSNVNHSNLTQLAYSLNLATTSYFDTKIVVHKSIVSLT